MSDIMFADQPKLKMRLILWYMQRELTKQAKNHGLDIPEGKTVLDIIHDDLNNSPNIVIRKLHSKLIEAAGYMVEPYQKATIADVGSFALWICYKDTAYNQPMYWALNELFNDKQIHDELKYYVVQPKDWYCPRWNKTKTNTKKLQDEGLIGKYQMSQDEEIFVPTLQSKKWYDILKQDIDNTINKK
jgi:hypothetical protein